MAPDNTDPGMRALYPSVLLMLGTPSRSTITTGINDNCDVPKMPKMAEKTAMEVKVWYRGTK